MLTLEKFEEAYNTVQKVVKPTPLIYSDYFSEVRYISNRRIFRLRVLIRSGVHIIRSRPYRKRIVTKA